MNQIKKHKADQLGYNFIPAAFLPAGKDEYYLRFQQNPATDYRPLTKQEITILQSNRNRSTNWDDVLVRDGIDIHLIEECTFYGLVRIGKLEQYFLEFSEVKFPVGLYHSQIVSCDIGDHVSISNVKFLAHYIIDEDVIIANVNEMSCTSHAKFGNGILKEGENENVRIWLELCNENAGRKVLPFDGMLAGDAWLWTKYRGDQQLMNAFQQFTEQQFDALHGYYGTVGKRTVIKNTHIIKDVKIGTDGYIKGASKLKNLTINSNDKARSQIGEGCEMVNGIMGVGSRAFYGVKAVRFILAPFSQLKYGARLINSYLGENATVSCCEVLNSLIFPAHEQHHNNSFLCAALVMGQSNMAAGATIGSNHNSRGADGEIQAGRGFWPGLCVSLKHNSRFASFTMIAKGNYPAELDIPFPFSLISNDEQNNKLVIMPAYWFMYNMYAIQRNERKFADRDKRIEKLQRLEFDCLAPDTVNEMYKSLRLLEQFAGKAFYKANKMIGSDADYIKKGHSLLEHESPAISKLNVLASGFENSKRPVQIIKVQESFNAYKKMLLFYIGSDLANYFENNNSDNLKELVQRYNFHNNSTEWKNVGGQLIAENSLDDLLEKIRTKQIKTWTEIHAFYLQEAKLYNEQKTAHALSILHNLTGTQVGDIDNAFLKAFFEQTLETKEWITKVVYTSKEKDYKNSFKNMVYDTKEEMEMVLGSFDSNSFIHQQNDEMAMFKTKIENLLKSYSK
ncbi:DUF4954 family protein [Niabella ginsengisoli]|uniref:DUF4954 family protein n=1 Tax=Niabella ginsengisoli TaxID=522298 RepID=A0ABS9SIZ9_9BACT|nr:DUF4954 family protein [Niabella ginsengisoli]MCH5598159.1 DUF4954 family protein [Niabella ginsengisoli]